MKNVKLIAGRSNLELANLVSRQLNIPLTECRLDDFGNSELRVEIKENIRRYHVYIIQTGCQNIHTCHSINDYFMELCSLIDACKRSNVKSVNVIMPNYPYARSDKKDDGRVPINGKMVANILQGLGVDRIIAMNLHSGQIQGFADVPFDNLWDIKLHIHNFRSTFFKNMDQKQINENYILIAPDHGAIKRIEDYARRLGMKFATMHKQRDYSKNSIVLNSMLVGDETIYEDIKGKTAIIIDDIVDSMGTMVSASNELQMRGVKEIIIVATHGIFSGPAFDRINGCDAIKKIIVTNTIPQEENQKMCHKLEVVDTSSIFAEIIKRLALGGSISELFV
jgi:ribose-phosphate pyrophosphokinase